MQVAARRSHSFSLSSHFFDLIITYKGLKSNGIRALKIKNNSCGEKKEK